MKALKCDRCKRFYIPYYDKKIEIKGKTIRANSVGVDFRNSGGVLNPQDEGIEYDLCERCLDRLISFLE